MSLIDRIQSNDPDLTDLRMTEVPEAYTNDLDALIESLKSNTVIQFVRFDRDFLPALNPEQVDSLFKAVGSLAGLKEILIWHAHLSAKSVAELIALSKDRAEHLQLGVLALEGTAEDFQSVADALTGHEKLKSFDMSDFSLNDQSISIDPIIIALSTMPNLERVKLEVTYQKRGSLVGHEKAKEKVRVEVSGPALATLCRSASLRDVHLSRLTLNLNDLEALADAIQTAPSLKRLALPHCLLNDYNVSGIARAIGHSTSLESVDLSCNHITDEGCIAIATALKGNTSVKLLRLWGNVKISNSGFNALAEMLESNCVLERVPLMANRMERPTNPKIQQKRATNQAA
mmetsp:Transcript_2805/g.5859  ORF Transcript_2805/g.5859 Transcript_2805/m.5859 type:complete len:345 (+) Transcript_2805:278-1312(+)|eukprot:scaffold6899_cov183-Amphora_coffeaeformis.AAC.27